MSISFATVSALLSRRDGLSLLELSADVDSSAKKMARHENFAV